MFHATFWTDMEKYAGSAINQVKLNRRKDATGKKKKKKNLNTCGFNIGAPISTQTTKFSRKEQSMHALLFLVK